MFMIDYHFIFLPAKVCGELITALCTQEDTENYFEQNIEKCESTRH